VMSCGDNFLIKSLNALLRASPPVAGVEWVCCMFVFNLIWTYPALLYKL
jgi:hypothetical protein